MHKKVFTSMTILLLPNLIRVCACVLTSVCACVDYWGITSTLAASKQYFLEITHNVGLNKN